MRLSGYTVVRFLGIVVFRFLRLCGYGVCISLDYTVLMLHGLTLVLVLRYSIRLITAQPHGSFDRITR